MTSVDNHVKFARFVFLADVYIFIRFEIFIRLEILFYYRDHFFFCLQSIIKQLLVPVFVVSIIVEVVSLRLRQITPTPTLIILDISKTSSNNCLQFYSVSFALNPLIPESDWHIISPYSITVKSSIRS